MPSLKLPKLPRRRPGSPSLKDRAAALKASAARVMHRGVPVAAPVISVPPAGADPRLVALVERCLDARCALNDPAVPDGPEADALGETETRLLLEILRFPAQSAHDLAAKLSFLREEAEDARRGWDARRGVPFESYVPGAAWAGLLRDIEHLAGVTPAAEIAPDPVHALIATHRAAYAEWDRIASMWGGMYVGTPEYAAAKEVQGSLGKTEVAALKALLQARPTTFAGLLALTEYLPDALRQVGQEEDAEPALRNVAASLRAIEAPSQFERATLDAGLIALGREFDALHAAWRQAEDANREPAARRRAVEDTARAQGLTGEAFYAVEKVARHLPGVAEAHAATDAAFNALEPPSREIFAAQAHTAAGVAIKARAVIPAVWGGGDYEEGAGDPDEEWDRRAVRQMIEAACAAVGIDWRGQPVASSEIQPKA